MGMSTEYEVYHPDIEAFVEPVSATTLVEAQRLVEHLNTTLPGWAMRAIQTGKEPIPPLAPTTTSITVHEARKLMAKHGQNILVLVAWNERDGHVNIVTAGSDRERSEGALKLGEDIANGLNLTREGLTEDRRSEHTK